MPPRSRPSRKLPPRQQILPFPEQPARRRPVRAPVPRNFLHPFFQGFSRFGQSVELRDHLPDDQVAGSEHVPATQGKYQEHLDGPNPDALDGGEGEDDFPVGHDGKIAVQEVLFEKGSRDFPQVSDFLMGKSGGPQGFFIESEEGFRVRDASRKQVQEAVMDGVRRLDGQLLGNDGFQQAFVQAVGNGELPELAGLRERCQDGILGEVGQDVFHLGEIPKGFLQNEREVRILQKSPNK